MQKLILVTFIFLTFQSTIYCQIERGNYGEGPTFDSTKISHKPLPEGFVYNEYGDPIPQEKAKWSYRNRNEYRTFSQNGKIGMKTQNETVLIPAEYDDLHYNFCGFMRASKNGKSGIINQGGGVVIPFEYQQLEVLNGKDRLNAPTGVSLENIRLLAQKSGESIGIIDGRGRVIFPFQQNSMTEIVLLPPTQNLEKKSINPSRTTSYEEKLRQTAILFRFKKAGAINGLGDTILPFEYDDISTIYDLKNTALVQIKTDEKVGFADLNGKILLSPTFSTNFELLSFFPENPTSIGSVFKTGKIIENNPNYQFGLVDSLGKILLPFEYDNINRQAYWMDGKPYFLVQKNQKWGLVNAQNNIVIPLQYKDDWKKIALDDTAFFVLKDSLNQFYGLVSLENKAILPFQYKKIQGSNGKLLVVVDEKGFHKLVNSKGEIIFVAPEKFGIGIFDTKHFSVYQQDGFQGLISPEGKLLTEIKYKSVAPGKNMYQLINTSHLKAKQLTEDDVEALLINADGYFLLTKTGVLVKI